MGIHAVLSFKEQLKKKRKEKMKKEIKHSLDTQNI